MSQVNENRILADITAKTNGRINKPENIEQDNPVGEDQDAPATQATDEGAPSGVESGDDDRNA